MDQLELDRRLFISIGRAVYTAMTIDVALVDTCESMQLFFRTTAASFSYLLESASHSCIVYTKGIFFHKGYNDVLRGHRQLFLRTPRPSLIESDSNAVDFRIIFFLPRARKTPRQNEAVHNNTPSTFGSPIREQPVQSTKTTPIITNCKSMCSLLLAGLCGFYDEPPSDPAELTSGATTSKRPAAWRGIG